MNAPGRYAESAYNGRLQDDAFAVVAVGTPVTRRRRTDPYARDYRHRHGTRRTRRTRPQELVPGTLRVVSVRMDYLPPQAADAWDVLGDGSRGYISRYALGRDYHKLMRRRLQQLADRIEAAIGPFGYRAFVDSAPVRWWRRWRRGAGIRPNWCASMWSGRWRGMRGGWRWWCGIEAGVVAGCAAMELRDWYADVARFVGGGLRRARARPMGWCTVGSLLMNRGVGFPAGSGA